MAGVHALYEQGPIGVGGRLEAVGVVYHFCSAGCRERFRETLPAEVPHAWGMDSDAIEGTVCEQCEGPLAP